MLHEGENVVRGVAVVVVRKRIRRINLYVRPDGCAALSVPRYGATLREAEAFLLSKWSWVLETRTALATRPSVAPVITDEMRDRLSVLLDELQTTWCDRLGEHGVTWRLRQMKTLWGSCHIRRRRITYNLDLAAAPRKLVEYVVVHELTHLRAADHGPRFYSLMNERLPGWQTLRRRLNRRDFGPSSAPPPPVTAPPQPVAVSTTPAPSKPVRYVQGELFDLSFDCVRTQRRVSGCRRRA